MHPKMDNSKRGLITIAVVLLGVFFFTTLYVNKFQEKPLPSQENGNGAVQKPGNNKTDMTANEDGIVQGDIVVMPTIDYNHLNKNKKLKHLMASRKASLGIKKSLDMIVKSDEKFKIGDTQISMRDILEKAFIKERAVFKENIHESGAVQPQQIKSYGIYVIRPGDNIWNIHFNILKEFYDHQGINVSAEADEPIDKGMSSGIGKILKFSETLVIIYNLIEKKVDSKIDLVEPLSKIVIYNMEEIFSLLQEVNYNNIDRIHFDGNTIWIPAKKS